MILFLFEIVNLESTKSAFDNRLIRWRVTDEDDDVSVFSTEISKITFGLNSFDKILGDIFKLNLFSIRLAANDLIFQRSKQAISSAVNTEFLDSSLVS